MTTAKSDLERRVASAFETITDDEIVEIEKSLVRIPSYTTEESTLAEYIADLLNEEGIDVGLQAVSFLGLPKAPGTKSHNVVGRIRGKGNGSSLLFDGHMDHGPIGGRSLDDHSRWSRPAFEPIVEDGYLYGKGSRDEKGGICAMLVAAIAIRRAGLHLDGDLIVAPVCGHKMFSTGTRRLLETGLRADMAINTEDSGNGIVPLHVGVFKAQIKVHGSHPHPKIRRFHPTLLTQPTPHENATRMLSALGKEAQPYQDKSWLAFRRHPILTEFPWHNVEEIDAINAETRVLHVWWRTPPGVTEETLRTDLDELLQRLNREQPTLRASAQVFAYGPALDVPATHPVVTTLADWFQRISGKTPDVGPDGRYGGYGDASLIAAAGIPCVAFGPGGGMSDLEHDWQVMNGQLPPDERISVADLILAARVSTATAIVVTAAA